MPVFTRAVYLHLNNPEVIHTKMLTMVILQERGRGHIGDYSISFSLLTYPHFSIYPTINIYYLENFFMLILINTWQISYKQVLKAQSSDFW